MSYALLWIETIALALIWMAAMLAVAAHFRSRVWFALAVLGIVLVPLVPIGGTAVAIAIARLMGSFYPNPILPYSVSQTIILVVGMAIILRRAQRPALTTTGLAAAGWPRGRLLLTLLMAFALWIMTAWNIELAARAQVAAVRQEAGAMMLSVVPPVANDAQNAAFIYEKAFRYLDADPDLKKNKDKNILNQEKPNIAGPAVAQFLTRHINTLSLIYQAVALPDCYFEHNYLHPDFSMIMPELGKLRQVARLLQLHRQYETARGNVGSAINDTRAMFRLADHTGRSPLLIAALVSIAIDGMAVKNAEEVLSTLTEAQQVIRLGIDDPDRIARMMRRAMTCEEAFGIATFSDLTDGRVDIAALVGTPESNGPTPAFAGGAFVRLCFVGNDLDDYRRTMVSYRQLLARPFYEVQPELREIDDQTHRPRGFMTALLLPALHSDITTSARMTAQLECARLAALATDYRIAKGQLPPTLESLMPEYLTEIPLDPFDGKPLRTKLTAEKLVIYSIGPDLKDDGGTEFDNKTKTGDITVTLKVK
ncbi:MAG: hypothetical protein ABSH20_15130 [Tepidisphaeraceae bacterium]|jgi:hypothetical protein